MRYRWFLGVLSVSLLNACHGAAAGIPSPGTTPPSTTSAHKLTTVSVKLTVPGAKSSTNTALRRILSIASNTQSIVANVYPAGNHTVTPLATTTANIASGSANCGASDSFGNRTCSFTLNVPVAVAVDFVFDTYDGAAGAGNAIGVGEDPNQTIAAGSSPTIPITLNSVLASVALNAVPAVIHSIVPQTVTLDVYGLDADNDIIVSSGYYDQAGNQETITISESGTTSTAPTPPLNGSLLFSNNSATTTITAPVPNGLQVMYNGNASDTGSPVTFNAAVAPTSVATTSSSLAVVYPTFTSGLQFFDLNLTYTGAVHGGAAFSNAPGPSPYFIYTTQAGMIDYFNYGTGLVVQSSGGSAAGYFGGSINDTANNTYYFVAQNGLYSVTDSNLGSVAPVSACSGSCPPGNASGLGFDSTNNFLYYTSGANLIQYSIAGGTTQSANIGVVAAGGVTVDSGGNIWVVQTGSSASVLKISNAFPSPTITPVTLYTNSQPFDVVTAGNGDIVVSDKQYNTLFVFSNAGNFVGTYNTNGVPWYLAPDPAQPDVVWFDYSTGGGTIGLGRLDIGANHIATEGYTTGPTGGQPGALAVSNNEGILMVDDGAGTLVQVQP